MPGGFAPRFAVEAAFLILLAVAAGLAELRPALIAAVMAGGWLLVTLIEYLVWRSSLRPAVTAPAAQPEAAPGWSVEEILVPEAELAEYPPAPEPDVDALTSVLRSKEPAHAKPRRRWLRRRKRQEAGQEQTAA